MSRDNTAFFKDAKIIFKRFSGDDFKKGVPTFCIELDDETADDLRSKDWPVKVWTPKPDENGRVGEPRQFLKVSLYFKGEGKDISPQIVTEDSATGKRTRYDNTSVRRLDQLMLSDVEVEIRRWWNDRYQNEGWCLALNRFWAKIESTDFDRKCEFEDDDDWATDDVDTL